MNEEGSQDERCLDRNNNVFSEGVIEKDSLFERTAVYKLSKHAGARGSARRGPVSWAIKNRACTLVASCIASLLRAKAVAVRSETVTCRTKSG